MSRIVSLREAVAGISSGTTVAFGGFQLNRGPMALVRELIRQKKKCLRLLVLPNPLPLDFLVGAGAVAFAEVAFAGFEIGHRTVVPPNWQAAVVGNRLRWRERDALYLVQALRAAAQGLPFLPLPLANGVPDGADVARVRNPFSGSAVAVVRSLQPEVALVHAQLADREGNLWIEDPVTDELVVRASQRVIATAEQIVSRLPRANIAGAWVDCIAPALGGAWPTACAGCYGEDQRHLEYYLERVQAGQFSDYVRRHVGRQERRPRFVR